MVLSFLQAALKEAKQSKDGGDNEIESLKSEVQVIFLASYGVHNIKHNYFLQI